MRRAGSAVAAIRVALLAFVAGAALLAWLGPGARTPPASTLVVALGAEPKSLDPHVTTAQSDFRVMENLYEGLVRFRPQSLDIEPALAESLSVSEDGLRYVFRLRPGVRFHDGTALDADVVKWNLERLTRPDHPFADTGPFPLAFFFESIARVTVRGPLEVELELEQPFAPLLGNLAYPTGFMVSPAGVRRHRKAFGHHPAGTGPFRLAEWHAGRHLTLERFEGYWGRPAKLERIVLRPIGDEMTRLSELRAQQVDLAAELPADALAAFRSDAEFEVHEAAGPHLWFLILNTRVGPFSDVRLRRAANLAVDKRALCERVLGGTASVASGPVAAAFDWVGAPLEPYPHDPERAKQLVRDSGYAGQPIKLLAPDDGSGMLAPLEMATAIQADLRRVGFEVVVETYEWQTYLTRVNAGLSDDVGMAEMAWMTNDPDTLPYLALRSAALPPKGFNSGYYQNAEVDRLLETARRSVSRDERARLYREVGRLVQADAPWVFVASSKQNVVTRRAVQGFRAEPSFFLLLAETHKG
jgi:peptide/nickel transport system substrate-binding protein